MLAAIKALLSKVRVNLTRMDDQPLGKSALIILVLLDLFILAALFDGLDQHTAQLTSPDEYIPDTCRRIVIEQRWNPTNRLDNLSAIVVAYSTSYIPIEARKTDRHPLCIPYLDALDRIKQNKALSADFEGRAGLVREIGGLQRKIGNLKGAYDTSLLETIAKQAAGQTDIDAVKKSVREETAAINTLQGAIAALDRKIEAHEMVQSLWVLLEGLSDRDRDTLKADLRARNFWFPVKRLTMQLAFLLPLFGIFYVWNGAAIRKGRSIQTLVSSHLLVVSFLPILFKIVEMLVDIIPKKLLKQVIDLLEALNLVAIWYYLVIAFGVAASLFLIYLFQKKLFSREKILGKRIGKGQCQQCGEYLPPASQACSVCGFVQFKICRKCGKPTHVHGKYCKECGSLQTP
jgi:hypothetical protein